MKESNNVIINGLKKLELNIFRITTQVLKAQVVSIYIERSLAHRYSIYETMRPVLVDLKQRMHYKNIGGFKIAVTGRFKRALRATYW